MILFIDDEKREMDSYIEELKLSGLDVTFQRDVDSALRLFQTKMDQIDLTILDIMMPPGRAFENDDTNGGLRTGLWLYEKLREMRPELPIAIFTNVSDERVAERFRKEQNCWFLSKRDYLPFELVEKVGEILEHS